MLMKASSLLEGDRADFGGTIGVMEVGFVDVRGRTTVIRDAHNRRTTSVPSDRVMHVIPPKSVVSAWAVRGANRMV